MRLFDRKFALGGDGERSALAEVPLAPGVYIFRDEAGLPLYVGKAARLRRRLAQYRNATRKKRDRKMSAIVRCSAALE